MTRFHWIVKTKTYSFSHGFFFTDCTTRQWTYEGETKADSKEELEEYLNAKYDNIYSMYIKQV